MKSVSGWVFEILDRSYLTGMRRERGFGMNPWRTHSRFLISHNLLIDPAYADPLREWLVPLLPGSLLIVDEAHHAAPSSGGRHGVETKFTRAVRDLSGPLRAPPLSFGYSTQWPLEQFLHTFARSLSFYARCQVWGNNALEEVMVRRLKEDIHEIQGNFPKREVRRVSINGLPQNAPEFVLSRLLDEYTEQLAKNASPAPRAARKRPQGCSFLPPTAHSLVNRGVRTRPQGASGNCGETAALLSGIDVRTVQLWLGHSDLETTSCYPKAIRGKQKGCARSLTRASYRVLRLNLLLSGLSVLTSGQLVLSGCLVN